MVINSFLFDCISVIPRMSPTWSVRGRKINLFYARGYPVLESVGVYNYFGVKPYRLLDVVLDSCI